MDIRRVWLGSGPGSRWAHINEQRKNSLWLVPTIAVIVAIVVAQVTLAIDEAVVRSSDVGFFASSPEDARQLVSTVSTAMLTFMGVVFSITLVALQLASTQYSPRVVRSFVRSPITKWTLAVFMATFTYSFTTLAGFDSADVGGKGAPFIPELSVAVAFGLVLASLFVFIAFVHTIVRSMRVTFVITRLADETRSASIQNFPASPARPWPAVPELGEPTTVVPWRGKRGVVSGIDIDRLVRLAVRHDVVLRFPYPIGIYLARDMPFIEIFGEGSIPEHQLRACVDRQVERTLYLDPAYGVRQLVDIAIRALSPAVNDPTTAVQVLDRLTSLLVDLVDLPEPTGAYADGDEVVRLVRPVLGWGRMVELSFSEIRHYGADSPQVSRRLNAALTTLRELAPPERQEVLQVQRTLLENEVIERVPDPMRQTFALAPDPMGVG